MNPLNRGLQHLLALARQAPAPGVEPAPHGFARRLAARWESETETRLPVAWRGPLRTAVWASCAVILASIAVLWVEFRPGEAAWLPTTTYQVIASHLIP